jgi:hypothetical protein
VKLLLLFQAEKLHITHVIRRRADGLLPGENKEKVKEVQDRNKQLLRIPRRWSSQKVLLLPASSFLLFLSSVIVIASVKDEGHAPCMSPYSNTVVNEFIVLFCNKDFPFNWKLEMDLAVFNPLKPSG